MVLSVVANIALGLVTSVVGGGLAWLWQRARHIGYVNRKASFFRVRPGETCLAVLGGKHNAPTTAQYADIRAIIEFAMLAGELGCPIEVESGDFRGGSGDRTEFCVGGPLGGANPRAGGHLALYLPGVTIHPYGSGPDAAAFEVGGELYRFDHDNEEYALAAKFTPYGSDRPVLLVCGHSPLANQAAIHFLRREYVRLVRDLESTERYCLLIKISGMATYAHHHAVLERDVTAAAFAS